jgi:hypothetical protein
MCRLYMSVVPQMLYEADVSWDQHYGAGRAALNKLGSVQRRAAILIVGGMCTSPTDMLYIHANLLLFHLLVVKVSCQSLV